MLLQCWAKTHIRHQTSAAEYPSLPPEGQPRLGARVVASQTAFQREVLPTHMATPRLALFEEVLPPYTTIFRGFLIIAPVLSDQLKLKSIQLCLSICRRRLLKMCPRPHPFAPQS